MRYLNKAHRDFVEKPTRKLIYHTKSAKAVVTTRAKAAKAVRAARKLGMKHSEVFAGERGYGAANNAKLQARASGVRKRGFVTPASRAKSQEAQLRNRFSSVRQGALSDAHNMIASSHAKGMAKIGRQKSDLNGGNSVNRAPKNHTTRTSQAQRIASKIAARLAKRRYSDNTMGMSGSAAGSSVYRSVGGKTMAFALSSSAANKLHKEMQRPMRKSIGMAGAKRPKGPASASSVSAARKKAWATRRKKFGKSGGKKRR